ncbi:hypothetical protein AAMO2058_000428400 [Amorphochlora amoebiformis]
MSRPDSPCLRPFVIIGMTALIFLSLPSRRKLGKSKLEKLCIRSFARRTCRNFKVFEGGDILGGTGKRPSAGRIHVAAGGGVGVTNETGLNARIENSFHAEEAAKIHRQAVSLHQRGEYSKSLEAFEKLLALPALPSLSRAQVLNSMGAARYMLSEVVEAKRLYEEAISVDSTCAEAWINLASMVYEEEDIKEAHRICGKGLALCPQNVQGHVLMGNILQSLGLLQNARRHWIEAEEISRNTSLIQKPKAHTMSKKPFETTPLLSNMKLNQSVTLFIGGRNITAKRVASHARVFALKNLLSHQECRHIQEVANNSLKISDTLSLGDSDALTRRRRVCENAWIGSQSDAILRKIEKRVKSLIFPDGEGRGNIFAGPSEQVQVVRYRKGDEFTVHYDASRSVPRFVTILYYINTPPDPAEMVGGMGSDVGSNESKSGGTWFPCAYGFGHDIVSQGYQTGMQAEEMEDRILKACYQIHPSTHGLLNWRCSSFLQL